MSRFYIEETTLPLLKFIGPLAFIEILKLHCMKCSIEFFMQDLGKLLKNICLILI